MILLSAQNISKTYMERKVLDDVSFFLNEGDKVGIVGINGTGKSTLLKILAGAASSDSGSVTRTNGIRVSYLPQIPEFDDSGRLIEQVLAHLPNDLRSSKEYEARSILGKLGLQDCDRDISSLSGGERRRAGIASALIQPSDVLLLDEPTNHIDNETSQLLEDLLLKYRGAIVMVTHDRYFLNRICNRIVEIDRGKLYCCEGSYSEHLLQKAQREADAEAAERKAKSLYRRELEWISRGARARGTKSKDRIERFEELKNRDVPVQAESVAMQSVSSRLGKKTIEIESISKSIDGKPLITDFSYIISRDARIGIVGSNGAGKSTFLKMLCGQIMPDSGRIVLGDTVNIGYFSQECEEMDPTLRVIEYIRETADIVRTPDGTVTASQMLERFLFNSELQWNRIEKLSGGERKRLYLLKILMQAPNILLLDEPTNDLDIAAVKWLEDFLSEYFGTVIVVSHDRHFLNNVCTRIVDIDYSEIKMYVGNYEFWYESSQLIQKLIKQQNKKNEEKAKELQAFIARFSANKSKSRQATSRKKLLDKLTIEELPASSRRYPFVGFDMDREVGKDILTVEGLTKEVDGVKLLNNVSFTVRKNDKIAFVGKSEQAITMLFKILMEEETPDSGSFKWGLSTSRSYFPADNSAFFNSDLNLIDWMRQYSKDQTETYIRGFLGRMLFSGDAVLKPVNVLSGGEKVRCMLSRMMLFGSNVLILDQPTNHLDLESITAVNNGLSEFKGNVLFCSHDYEIVNTVANRIIEICDDGIIDHSGNYDDFVEFKESRGMAVTTL